MTTFLLSPDVSLVDDEPGDDSAPCLWAWLAIDGKGTANLIAGHVTGVGMVTLVTTSESHARGMLRDAAVRLARTGRSVELRQYLLHDVVERL